MPVKPGRAGVKQEMTKFGAGKLHSGSPKGPIVTSRPQAIAISLKEAGLSKPKRNTNPQGAPTQPTKKTPSFNPRVKKPGPGGLY